MTENYIPDTDYAKLVAALLKVATSPGYDIENEIKTALGEHGDIWPASISSDVADQPRAAVSAPAKTPLLH